MDMSDEETPGKTASAKKRKKLDSDQLRVSQSFRIFPVTLAIMMKTLKIWREKILERVSKRVFCAFKNCKQHKCKRAIQIFVSYLRAILQINHFLVGGKI